MRRSVLAVLLMVLLTGCFEVEQSIVLDKNMSGTADFHLGIDLEPMIVVMAQFAREMEGKEGPATAADIAKAKAEFKKKNSAKDQVKNEAPTRAEIEKDLPEGVKLLDFSAREKDFGVVTDFKFGFENLRNLVNVKLPQKEGADPTQKSVIDTPFEGLEIIEKGDRLTIQTKPQNPTEKVEQEAEGGPKLDAATEKLIKDAFSKMRVVYRITAPFPVLSHNATRKEGNTLIWEFDLEKFEAMEKAKKLDDAGVKVTYRR
jgi:hypothetical protein